jgi:tetratricopeptide (TPR) repeat protein
MINSILNEISKEEKNSQNNNIQNSQINLKKIFDDSDYLQNSIEAFQYIKQKDYTKAQNCYKECINIARNLEDDYKFTDSLANYSITQFFCGKIKETIENLEMAYRMSSKMVNFLERNKIVLHLKIMSNLSLAYLSLGKKEETMIQVSNIIDFIKREKEMTNRTHTTWDSH